MLDSEYSPISSSEVNAFARDYEKDTYVPDVWDCDDIARDFTNYVKKKTKETKNENAAFGWLIFPEHVQEVFAEYFKTEARRNRYEVKYLDHRDWRIYTPNRRPRWILM